MCGSKCESKRFTEPNGTKICADSCQYYEVNYTVASDNNSVYIKCVNSCPNDTHYYTPNKTCMSSCPIEYNYVYQDKC